MQGFVCPLDRAILPDMETSPPASKRRTLQPNLLKDDGTISMVVKDHPRAFRLLDVFRAALRLSWPRLLLYALLGYLSVSALFCGLYRFDMAGLKGFQTGSWTETFFFSAQVLATGGMEGIIPISLAMRCLHLLETLLGLLSLAMLTGLCFAKLSLPGPRIRFSKNVLATHYDGQPALVLRVANEQDMALLDVTAELVVILDAPTAEGVPMKRLFELPLIRDHAPLFILSWNLVHILDESSPLYEMLQSNPKNQEFLIYANIGGLDRSIGQTTHAFHAYSPEDMIQGGQFKDVVEVLKGGKRRLRLDYFDHVIAGNPQDNPPEDGQ